MLPLETILYATLGGLFPALIWLWFFLREDREHPEPKLLILLAFIAGMLSVFVALALEKFVAGFFTTLAQQAVVSQYLADNLLLFTWAAIEEIVKFGAAAAAVLWRPYDDEPIDPIIYMITVALGFSALETGLFLLGPLLSGDVLNTILTSNLRFLGASLLHVVASAVVGVALAFAFYQSFAIKVRNVLTGLILAIVLHALFNFFIIQSTSTIVMIVFFFVWLSIVVLFLLFERVKRISKPLFIKK